MLAADALVGVPAAADAAETERLRQRGTVFEKHTPAIPSVACCYCLGALPF